MQKFGFNLEVERQMSETGGLARLWRHEKTGARMLSICNDDENKCFGVSFYTPPANSTGVAHILEHSVLCGSIKYPVKEPFAELLKGSLQTFLNAFTFPDKTCYPVASTNLQDFYNLMDVYLDAVFYPILSSDTFKQEGWHIEALDNERPWTYKGVVFNEMKGVYSSPDSILAEKSQQSIFPDNLYSLDSGGFPAVIPELSYQDFLDFHQRYYHPTNSFFFFWGDDPEDERLRRIAHIIDQYEFGEVFPCVPLQKRLDHERRIDIPYAAAQDENRALFTMNWLLGERGDVLEALKMEMLEHILEGLPGSPLRRILIESGLGEDTAGCGLETDLRQMYYSTGLKGIDPADIAKAEQLILDTLQSLVREGIDPDAINAAVNTVEFAYRENNTGRFPRGLSAMVQALSTWIYNGNPLDALAWEKPLNSIKEAVEKGERIFEKTLEDYFINNPHRTVVTLLPDKNLASIREQKEAERLALEKKNSSIAECERIILDTQRLLKAQSTPDDPANLAKIPSLTIADLPTKNSVIPRVVKNTPQTFVYSDLQTHGIVYTSLLLSIKHIPQRLIPYLPLFCRSLLECGTAKEDYVKLGSKIAGKLGGFSAGPYCGFNLASKETYCYLQISARSTSDHLSDLFSVMQEVILEPQTNKDIIIRRLSQMIPEDKARMEYFLQTSGHVAINTRLRAHYRSSDALNEIMAGINQLVFIRSLEQKLEKEPETILQDFEELRRLITGKQNSIFNCVAEYKNIEQTEKYAQELISMLPSHTKQTDVADITTLQPLSLPHAEAFITPSQVNFVGKALNLYDSGYKYQGSAHVILRWLRMGKLWDDVRVLGGAYGVSCGMDRINGTFSCTSYRDPTVDNTISVYDGLSEYLQNFHPTQQQLTQAIVGAVGDMDAYMLPDAKGALALRRLLSGITDEMLQKTREEMLATKEEDFREFADALSEFASKGAICVLGGSETERAAKTHGWKECTLL